MTAESPLYQTLTAASFGNRSALWQIVADDMKRIISAAIVALVAFSVGVTSKSLSDLFRHWDTRRPPTGVAQKVGSYWIYQNQYVEAEPSLSVDDVPRKARGESVFIVFYPTGEFASIGCAIYTADGAENMRIMVNDEFIVHRGSWKRNDDGTITTTWRPTHLPPGNRSSAVERKVIFKPIGNVVSERGLLEGGGNSYVQIFDQEIENLDVLPGMIAANDH